MFFRFSATEEYLQIRQWCRDTFKNYVVFTKSIFFILGLIFSYKLVEKIFLDILMTILNDAQKEYDLRNAVVVVNLLEGMSAVLVVFFAYAADVYTGHYAMVLISTGVCIIGLFMSIFAASYGGDGAFHLHFDLFYSALALMTLVQAAETSSLEAFLDGQMIREMLPRRAQTDNNDDTAAQRQRRTKFWWTLVSFAAATFAQFGPLARQTFRNLAIILTSLMGACLFLFLLGTKYYNSVPRNPNPFKDTKTVIVRAFANRKADYTLAPEEPPRLSWLRWLERAAIATETLERPSSGEEVRRVKLLLKMLPLWYCFLSLSLVVASGSTFFFEEAYILAPNNIRAILLFNNLQRFTEVMVSEISSYVVEKLRERKQYNEQKMELVRVGVGMSFSVPCCIAAWVMAMSRQRSGGTMSVYWLIPQYFLIGVMTGLSLDGVESFYKSQVSETLARYGQPFRQLVMGVGRFMSTIFILVLSKRPFEWFKIYLVDSHVHRYYILLAVLSLGNVVLYCLVAYRYGDDYFLKGGDQEMLIVDQLMEGVKSNNSGDIITIREGSCSKEEDGEEETDETPLTPSESNKNSTYKRLHVVTNASRMITRATPRKPA